MVGFINILSHQWCRTSRLSSLQIRGWSLPLGLPSGSLGEWQQFCGTAPSPSRQVGMLSIFTFIPPVKGGRERGAGRETQFRIKWNSKVRELVFYYHLLVLFGVLQPSTETSEMWEGMCVQGAVVSLLSLCPDQEIAVLNYRWSWGCCQKESGARKVEFYLQEGAEQHPGQDAVSQLKMSASLFWSCWQYPNCEPVCFQAGNLCWECWKGKCPIFLFSVLLE